MDFYDEDIESMYGAQQNLQEDKLLDLYKLYQDKIESYQFSSLQEVKPTVILNYYNQEEIGVYHLLLQDNPFIAKILLVFASLKQHTTFIQGEVNRILPTLHLYGESWEDVQEGESEVMISKISGIFLQLLELTQHCNNIVCNIMHQLSILYTKQQKIYGTFKTIKMFSVLDLLNQVLTILITIDQVVHENQNINQHWTEFKRMLKLLKDSKNYSFISQEQMYQLEKNCFTVERIIIQSCVFESCLTQPPLISSNLGQNKNLYTLINEYIAQKVEYINEHSEYEIERIEIVGLCGIFALYKTIFPSKDSTLYKKVWSVQSKIPVVFVYNSVPFYVYQFMNKFCYMKVSKLHPSDPQQNITQFLQKQESSFKQSVNTLNLTCAIWVSRINNLGHQDIDTNMRHILQGIMLSSRLKHMLNDFMVLRFNVQENLQSGHLESLCRCIELVSLIKKEILIRNQENIAMSFHLWLYFQVLEIEKVLQPLIKKIQSKKKVEKHHEDSMSAIKQLLHLLKGPFSQQRLEILPFCLDLIQPICEIKDLALTVSKIQLVANFPKHLQKCEFLYWFRDLLPSVMEVYLNNQLSRISDFAYSLHDPLSLLQQCIHKENLEESYKKEILNVIKEHLISPLCRSVEDELRVFIHSLRHQEKHPKSNKPPPSLLKVTPFNLFDITIDLKKEVQFYLSETFYNMACIYPNDCQNYKEMSFVAKLRWGLEVMPLDLPFRDINVGLDISTICQNLDQFLQNFHYNAHSQLFIQEPTKDNPFVKLVQVLNCTTSLKNHGFGIINRAIQACYKQMVRLIQVLAQLMQNEMIGSHLEKDRRFFAENREQFNNCFPFERVEALLKEFKNQQIDIAEIKDVITQIGNILGFVRLMKFAALINLKQVQMNEDLPEELLKLKQNQDEFLKESHDYFQLFINVFKEVVQKNNLLVNFFVLLPTLVYNFSQFMMTSKEKIKKKTSHNALFSDDGFILGFVYILKIGSQMKKFEGLNWWDSVKKGMKTEVRRDQIIYSELQLVMECYNSVKVFFK